METCKICNQTFNRLSRHIVYTHKIPLEEYYIRYINVNAGKCTICGDQTKFISLTKGFNKTCSDKCKLIYQQQQRERSLLSSYGVTNVSLLPSTTKARQDTMINRYGTPHALQNENIKKKFQDTISERTQEQREATKKLKIQNTNYESRNETSRNTTIRKYGVPHHMQVPEIKADISNKTALTKIRNNFNSMSQLLLLEKNIIPLYGKDDIYQLNSYKYKCNNCGNEFANDFPLGAGKYQYIHCNCQVASSYPENEIYNFISTILPNHEIVRHARFTKHKTTYEIDIYIPEYNIGIEFDGQYWHNFDIKGRTYHLNKTNFFKEQDISLIHIFESEWKFKREIVQSILAARLHKLMHRVYARNTTVKIITNEQYKPFLNSNHLSGYSPAQLKYGLFHNDTNTIVSVMGIGKRRYGNHNQQSSYELIRFANVINTNVIGGFSKLLTNILKQHDITELISYIDRRYYEGSGYYAFGFNFINYTPPNYFYYTTTDLTLRSRLKFQKHKLRNTLPIYDETLSEYQNMKLNGFLRIFDCGNILMQYKKGDN